jgi:hypothetical protein
MTGVREKLSHLVRVQLPMGTPAGRAGAPVWGVGKARRSVPVRAVIGRAFAPGRPEKDALGIDLDRSPFHPGAGQPCGLRVAPPMEEREADRATENSHDHKSD